MSSTACAHVCLVLSFTGISHFLLASSVVCKHVPHSTTAFVDHDVTSLLKSKMRQRDENQSRPGVSVAARASFFTEEQKRANEVVPSSSKTPLHRHPSAKIPPVDKKDTEVAFESL